LQWHVTVNTAALINLKIDLRSILFQVCVVCCNDVLVNIWRKWIWPMANDIEIAWLIGHRWSAHHLPAFSTTNYPAVGDGGLPYRIFCGVGGSLVSGADGGKHSAATTLASGVGEKNCLW
jgi:hypothetical protein